MRNLQEIRQIIEKLASQINPPDSAMPTYDNFRHDGTPNIEVGESVYYYRALDRDAVTVNRQTANLATLLYWVFEDITSIMASDYVSKHWDTGKDPRMVMFKYQLSLLEKVNGGWRDLREKEIAEMLQASPYRD